MNAKRDWGHAKDYVEAMWLMLQHEKPDDFVIASGNSTSVRDFVKKAFNCAGISVQFSGKGLNEKAVVTQLNGENLKIKIGQEVLIVDSNYYRPTEVDLLQGDATKAKKILGWKPKYSIDKMVQEMVQSDLELFSNGKN